MRAPAGDRCAPTPADRAAVAWLHRAFPGRTFTLAEVAERAVAFYLQRPGGRIPGVPLRAPAWRGRLRGLWVAGLIERRTAGGLWRLPEPPQQRWQRAVRAQGGR